MAVPAISTKAASSPLMPSKAPVALYREDAGKAVGYCPKDFYSSEVPLPHALMSYIDADTRKDQPFFAYLAFTAPTGPCMLPMNTSANMKAATM